VKYKIFSILFFVILFKYKITTNDYFDDLKTKSTSYLTNHQIHQYIESSIKYLNEYHKNLDINDIGQNLSSKLAILYSMDTICSDPTLIRNSKYGFWKIIRKMTFTNFSKYFDKNYKKPMQQFIYHKGVALEKKITKKSFTILSFNVCFTPDDMPVFFGGMLPWKKRIDKVVAFIEKADPDVITLQEVFDKNAQDHLYKLLKNKYSHFYTHIGPWQFNGKITGLGFNCGLFVASKYPLKNPHFYPFKNDNPHINRGVFTFDITSSNKIISSVFTTHLEPFKNGKNLRKKELLQVIHLMQKSGQKSSQPIILCGDLNLSIDEAKKFIPIYFENSLNIDELKITPNNFTHHDFTNKRLFLKPTNDKLDYFDYILILKNNVRTKIKTSIMNTFDINNLDNAISDHNAIFSKIDF
jgi:endonuclease/exonuclease/phosphatase family metal-dependent hydrolase